MIRLAIAAMTATALIATPALAQFPGQAPAAPAAGGFPGATEFQVTRPTDAAMTCEQILAEANPLNDVVNGQKQAAAAKLAEEQAAAEKAAAGRRRMGSLLGGAIGLGAQTGMLSGALSNPLARQALTAASQGANTMQTTAAAPVAGAPASPPTVEEQRMTVLLALYTEKRCGG